jgi:hypothetical protein
MTDWYQYVSLRPAAALLQSPYGTVGHHAGGLERLWWMLFWVSAAAFVMVIGVLAVTIAREAHPAAGYQKRRSAFGRGVALATLSTVLLLFYLLLLSIWTGRTIA